MYKVSVNGKYHFELEDKGSSLTHQDEEILIDSHSGDNTNFHILYNNKSYNVEIVERSRTGKEVLLKVNGTEYYVELSDQYDELLHKLGLDKVSSHQISELKAPMPGLVLKLLVEEGASVSKGDNLIILEAMKMENIIKSPIDGIVKTIRVKAGDKLEKNQVMLNFG
ncbi:MAG: biotin/lipoyl-binding protein [Sphingobacteriaceae bacterium]|nr:biotin/lipoyl-binding protein [Sphingobacteriaceae bacterium]